MVCGPRQHIMWLECLLCSLEAQDTFMERTARRPRDSSDYSMAWRSCNLPSSRSRAWRFCMSTRKMCYLLGGAGGVRRTRRDCARCETLPTTGCSRPRRAMLFPRRRIEGQSLRYPTPRERLRGVVCVKVSKTRRSGQAETLHLLRPIAIHLTIPGFAWFR